MTYEKVLKHYKDNHCKYCCSWNKELRHCDDCMVATAIEALEKQIPKKPKRIKIPNTSFTKAHLRCECPICNERVDDDGRGYEQPYCMECGQALDWGE